MTSSRSTWRAWVLAARLRTLPLSLAGIVAGNALAWRQSEFQWPLFFGAVLTASLFQILSNFANDYGDGIKGTDNKDRLGPPRALQMGLLRPGQLRRGIWIVGVLSLFSSGILIAIAFPADQYFQVLLFLILAVLAVVAAIKYTVGNHAYGYKGLGDVFVFLFFGGVSVLGSYYLQVQQLSYQALLFTICFGGLSVGVLNLNNMRDVENDKASGKNTLVVQWGLANALIYQCILIGLAALSFTVVLIYSGNSNIRWLGLIFPVLMLYRLPDFRETPSPEQLDRGLKPLAITAFFVALGYWILMICLYGA